MFRRRPEPIPLLLQCFVQRLEKERILPRGWGTQLIKTHYGRDWAVEFYRGKEYVGDIALSSIERRIGECLDNDVLQLIAKAKEETPWKANKQSA